MNRLTAPQFANFNSVQAVTKRKATFASRMEAPMMLPYTGPRLKGLGFGFVLCCYTATVAISAAPLLMSQSLIDSLAAPCTNSAPPPLAVLPVKEAE